MEFENGVLFYVRGVGISYKTYVKICVHASNWSECNLDRNIRQFQSM